ncbi:MAG TPA: class I SAM-dependent methyltransferase [Methylomirabilota bacterium]|nr:class I SAM-dependent methyltransferase [Methylomirabilota bacterium]
MNEQDALRLIEPAVPAGPGVWADFGAGDGTFTRALVARLGMGVRVYAVDRDARSLGSVSRALAGVTIVRADLEAPFELPGAEPGTLDGLLLANTLHFMREPSDVLARLASWLRPGGSAVLIEYDQRSPSRWVPHPIDAADLPALFESAGLEPPRIVARADSAFGGEMYVAVGRRQ